MSNTRLCPRDASIDEKVAFLRSPEAYPCRPASVDVVETHMSWVFLVTRFVYKLKKPVRYAFFDFRTLEARRRSCEREVALNRRLAGDVYCGVVPLVRNNGSGLRLAVNGEKPEHGAAGVVEWLVKMRRLPADRMLDALIAARALNAEDARMAGKVLTDFYRKSEPVAISAPDYLARFADDVSKTRVELTRADRDLPAPQVDRLSEAQQRFLDERGDVLLQRARDGRIVDAHGDLRPEHICLTAAPAIIDCLEFSRDLRLLDPVDELAYLAMECERLGAAETGEAILRHYLTDSGDTPPAELIAFYKAFRACLRAKIAIWHLADLTVRDGDEWRRRSRDYLDLAERYVRCW